MTFDYWSCKVGQIAHFLKTSICQYSKWSYRVEGMCNTLSRILAMATSIYIKAAIPGRADPGQDGVFL